MTDDTGIDIVEGPKTFKTKAGVEFIIKPISQRAIIEMSINRKVVSPPTFEVETLGGEKETHDYDLEYVKTHEAEDPTVREKWTAYVQEANQVIADHNERFGRMIMLLGTEIEVPGEDSEWQKIQECIGIIPPAVGTPERKLFYLAHAILTDDRDMENLTADVLSLGRVDKEFVRLAQASFRGFKERAAARKSDKKAKPLEGEPAIQRD